MFLRLMLMGVMVAWTNGAILLAVDRSWAVLRWFCAFGFALGLLAAAVGGFWWGRYERRRRDYE